MMGTQIKTKRVRLSYMIKFAVKMPSYTEPSEIIYVLPSTTGERRKHKAFFKYASR
jgi:hypothetical protein